MKTYLLSLALLCATLTTFAQNPCVKYYSVKNLGGGDCQTAGTGSNKYYPGYLTQSSNAGFTPTGKFVVYFDGTIAAGVAAPEIISVVPDNGSQTLSTAFDYKYAAYSDNINTPRSSVTYCYYGSASNQNIFNGAKEPKLLFTIKYTTVSGTQQCGNVTEVPSTLPVSLTSFTAVRDNNNVLLKWQTATEENNSGFTLQIKTGDQNWRDVSFISSKAHIGSSVTSFNYEYIDANNNSQISLYRLKQIDISGKISYSEMRAVKGIDQQFSKLSVFPNPARDNFSIQLPDDNAFYDLQILDASGRMVKQFAAVKSNKTISNLRAGQYLVVVINKQTNTKSSSKVVVQ